MERRKRCTAAVYKRDTYRCGGIRKRFELCYTKEQCKRAATKDGLCTQHAKCYYGLRLNWNEYV